MGEKNKKKEEKKEGGKGGRERKRERQVDVRRISEFGNERRGGVCSCSDSCCGVVW